MTALHLSNLDLAPIAPASSRIQVQAGVLYQWLTFVNRFVSIEASGSWNTVTYSSTDGYINGVTPNQFYSVNSAFTAIDVGKYIAVRDTDNPTNNYVGRITAVVSPTQVTLEPSSDLDISANDLEFRVFDPQNSPPVGGDYFVIETPSPGVTWQARCHVRNAAPFSLEWEFGFIGGWNTATSTWDLPVSATVLGDDDSARMFCVSDDALGYVYVWTEETGGLASARNAYWFGTLAPFHSPGDPGVPSDTGYSAIFGTTGAAQADNLSLDTAVATNVTVGEALSASLVVIPVYIAQKRLLSTGSFPMDTASFMVNPFSSEIDDYDAVAFHTGGDLAWRGKVPGLRLLNTAVPNRSSVSGNLTYVLGNGVGAVWNGKVPQP